MPKFKSEYKTTAIYKSENELFVIGVKSFGSWQPIGLRLAKRDPLPDYPIYCSSEQDAINMTSKWQAYFDSQIVKRKRKRA